MRTYELFIALKNTNTTTTTTLTPSKCCIQRVGQEITIAAKICCQVTKRGVGVYLLNDVIAIFVLSGNTSVLPNSDLGGGGVGQCSI